MGLGVSHSVFLTKYSSTQIEVSLTLLLSSYLSMDFAFYFLHNHTRLYVDSTGELPNHSHNHTQNHGGCDGNLSKQHHPRPTTPPWCWPTCVQPAHGSWPNFLLVNAETADTAAMTMQTQQRWIRTSRLNRRGK